MGKEIVLSIGLLASNRKETIIKCIESLNRLREKVACELIVTDTGCDDELRTYLENEADCVNHFAWCNDFSAARNANLSVASGLWYLYLDDDEWFEDTSEIEQFFLSGEYRKYECANYIQRNYKRYDGALYNDCWVSRMIRLSKEVRFAGKIHEFLTPENSNCRLLHSYVHHYGYIYENEEVLHRHYERNARLLKEMIEEEPDAFRWRTHLAKEYVGVKAWDELDQLGMAGLTLTERIPGTESDVMRGTFYLCRIQSAYETKQYEAAVRICEAAIKDKHNTKLGRAAILWWNSKIRMELFAFADAYTSIKEYLKLAKEVKQDPQNLALQMMAPMVCLCLDEDYEREALDIEKNADEQGKKLIEIAKIKENNRKKKTMLSIALLMSNRRETAQKCLDSLTTLRRAVPSELIVTDTGCDKPLRHLIDQYADRVNEFKWCNDFSAARNLGLSESKGEWYMFLDDDEWFEDTKEIIDFFKKGYDKQFDHAYYIQRNYSNWEGTAYSDSYVLRILKRTPDMHFEGKIHEYLLPEKKKGLALHSAVDHYGYIYKSDEDARKHYERNRYLLEQMIAEEPYTLRWRTHLANEYIVGENYDELYALGVDGIRVLEKPELIKEKSNHDIQLGTFYAAQIMALLKKRNYDEAQKVCRKALEDKRNTKACRGYIYYSLAEICLAKKEHQACIDDLEHYLDVYDRLIQDEGAFIAQKTAHIVGSIFNPENIQNVFLMLVIEGLETRNHNVVKKYIVKIDFAKCKHDSYSETLIQKSLELENGSIDSNTMGKFAVSVHENDTLWAYMCAQIYQKQREGVLCNKDLMEGLRKLHLMEEVSLYMKWKDAERDITQGEISLSFAEAWKKFENYYCACEAYMNVRKGEHFMDEHVDILATDCVAALLIREAAEQIKKDETLYRDALSSCASIYTPFTAAVHHLLKLRDYETSTFEECVEDSYCLYIGLMIAVRDEDFSDIQEAIRKIEFPALEHLFQSALSYFVYDALLRLDAFCEKQCAGPEVWKRLLHVLVKRELVIKLDRTMDIEQVQRILWNFSDCAIAFATEHYQQEQMQDEMEQLPCYVQTATMLRDALTLEESELPRALDVYRNIVRIDAAYANTFSYYIRMLGEKVEQTNKQAKELEALKNKILADVQDKLQKRQYSEAIAILSELKKVVPNDLQVASLALETRLLSLE